MTERREILVIRAIIGAAGEAVICTGAGLVARFHKDFRAYWVDAIRDDMSYGRESRLDGWSLILLSKGTKNLETIDEDIEAYHLKYRKDTNG